MRKNCFEKVNFEKENSLYGCNRMDFFIQAQKNVSEEQFIERTKELHDEVISKAKGFISWEHYLQDNVWTDFVLWETKEDANNATTVGTGKAVTENFYACIQMNTCRALISKLVKKY